MRHTSKLAAIIAAATLAVTALAGCTATEEKPAAEKPAAAKTTPAEPQATEKPDESTPSTPPASRQDDWDAAVASFTHELPTGASWPAKVPEDWPAGGTTMNGSEVATYFWACSTIAAANTAAESGDSNAAAKLIATANEVPPPYGEQQNRTTWDVLDGVPTAGDSGLCAQWFDGWVAKK